MLLNHPFFSKSITKFLNEGDSLIDLGCGNGRDTIYFAEKNIYTNGVDMVAEQVAKGVMSLPMNPFLTEEEFEYISQAINNIYR